MLAVFAGRRPVLPAATSSIVPIAVTALAAIIVLSRPCVAHGQAASAPGQPQTADDPPTFSDTVQVTATRFGETVAKIPGSVHVIPGDDMRARGATDLRTALSLVSGVTVAPGGDEGPAGAVPGLLGVREVDDLLLLIDGIPAGGAFIPQLEAVTLTNVERIEVMRGAVPVYYGTTAFAGTINVIHYQAGEANRAASVRVGSYQSGAVTGATIMSAGRVLQSLAAEWSRDGYADPRAGSRRGQFLWRLSSRVGGGVFKVDADVLALRQKPNSPSPVEGDDGGEAEFSPLLPVDFNQNPANARLNTDRVKLVLDYDRPFAFGSWRNTAAFTRATTDSVRGFIDTGDTPLPWTRVTLADLESFQQARRLRELFLDSNLTLRPAARMNLTTGVNLLTGHADADSLRFGQRLQLDGVSQVPDTDTVAPKGTVNLTDRRRFIGVYAQSHVDVSDSVSLLAGARWNATHETREQLRVNSRGVRTVLPGEQDVNRLTGSIGATWRAWQPAAGSPIRDITLHGHAGYTFQPAQIDFSPNPEAQPDGGGLLKPESQRSLIGGLRIESASGRAEFDVDGLFVDFYHQPVQASASGVAVLRSIGQQRFQGLDVETALRPTKRLTVRANIGWNNAHYVDYVTDVEGVPTQLKGNRQVLTPGLRAGAGVIYARPRGWRASLSTAIVGDHWLNSLNTFAGDPYAIVDATLGYRFSRLTLMVMGANLGNRRDAVQVSELGEGMFYRMPARRVETTLSWHFN